MFRLRLAAFTLLILLGVPFAVAQNYTSIVVFGDSLSDSGNDADLFQSLTGLRYPGPTYNYTDGRFTDGTDTMPAAVNYRGVWIEQLAATLPGHPAITASLAGGTDYAYGGATTQAGTLAFTEQGVTANINNMGQQVTDYLTAHPAVPANTLFVVWGGTNDLAALASSGGANAATIIPAAANREVALVQQLISAGATDIMVPNLPPLGDIPRFNTDPIIGPLATQAAAAFNTTLKSGLDALQAANPTVTLHLFQLDTYTLLDMVVGAPASVGLTNVTLMARGATGINPDQYLFWDDLHPTTAGHHLLAVAAAAALAPAAAIATTTVISSNGLTSNFNSPVTFTVTVTATAANPPGSVTILDGSTALGTAPLTASGSNAAVATFSTSTLSGGPHIITASYAANAGFLASTSTSITQTVVLPAVTTSLTPASITVAGGVSGTSTLTVTPVGGFSGTAAATCGPLPAHLSCTIAPASLTFTSAATAQTATVTINTNASAALRLPIDLYGPGGLKLPGGLSSHSAAGIVSAVLLPCFGLGLFRLRHRTRSLSLLSLLGAVTLLGGAATLSGCGGGSSNKAAAGTYTVTIAVTAAGANSSQTLTVVVQ